MTGAGSIGPSLTIAIPVYERTQGLDKAIESAANQTVPGVTIDIVVVDDASSTDVAGYVDRAAKGLTRPIRYSRNPKNLGLCGNWNHCLEIGWGTVVNILHSDESLSPDAAARSMDAFRRDPRLAMVCSGKGRSGAVLDSGAEAVSEVMNGVQPVSSVFLRTSLLDAARVYDQAFPYFPDLELYPRIASRHPVLFLDAPPLATAKPHSRHHMFRTWEKDDFIDTFTAVRRAGHLLAGMADSKAAESARSDASHACQHILSCSTCSCSLSS